MYDDDDGFNDGFNEETLTGRIWRYVKDNPGVDAEDVADKFRIEYALANQIIERLMNDGRLDFA